MALLPKIFLCFLLIVFPTYSYGNYAFLNVRSSKTGDEGVRFCVNTQRWTSLLKIEAVEQADSVRIAWWNNQPTETDVCLGDPSVQYNGGQIVPAIYRTISAGTSCSIRPDFNITNEEQFGNYQLTLMAEANVSSVLFLMEKGKSNAFYSKDYLFDNFYNPFINVTQPKRIFYIYKEIFDNEIASKLLDSTTELRFYAPTYTFIDAAALVLWVLAVSSVALGSVWGAQKAKKDLQLLAKHNSSIVNPIVLESEVSGQDEPGSSETTAQPTVEAVDSSVERALKRIRKQQKKHEEVSKMSAGGHCFSVVIAVGFLVVILMASFFFRDYAVWFFNLFMVVAGSLSIYQCVYALLTHILPFVQREVELFSLSIFCRCCRRNAAQDEEGSSGRVGFFNKPFFTEPFQLFSSGTFITSFAIGIYWFIHRDDYYAFVLLDFINVCLCIYAIKDSSIRSLRAAIKQMNQESDFVLEREEQGLREEDQVGEIGEDFEFVIMHKSVLDFLFLFCPQCGKLPYERKRGSKNLTADSVRNLKYHTSGTNVSVGYLCSCNGGKNQIRIACQPVIENTGTRIGNVTLSASMMASGIDYPNMKALCSSMKMPLFAERRFRQIKRLYIHPSIRELYQEQKDRTMAEIFEDPEQTIEIALDSQYDSPGFSSILCRSSAMHLPSKKILTVAIVDSNQVENVSNRMEPFGTKQVISELMELGTISSVTMDKHAVVMKMIRELGIPISFDPWHILHGTNAKIRPIAKKMKDPLERDVLNLLKRRWLIAMWNSSKLEGDPQFMKEKVISFFLHAVGVHEWELPSKFSEMITLSQGTKVGKEFKTFTFTQVGKCSHGILDENASPPVPVESVPFQKLLEVAFKAPLLDDIAKFKPGNATSSIESYHSVLLMYGSKRKFYPKEEYRVRTMLGILHWNSLQNLELSDQRRVIRRRLVHSKARGTKRMKTEKESGPNDWRREIVDRSVAKKRLRGRDHLDPDEDESNPEEHEKEQALADLLHDEEDQESESEEEEVEEGGLFG